MTNSQGEFPSELESLLQTLEDSLQTLETSPSHEESQRSVCLATRSLDSFLYTEAIFNERLDEELVEHVARLFTSAISKLPQDSLSFRSVKERFGEFTDWCEGIRTGKLLAVTSESAASSVE